MEARGGSSVHVEESKVCLFEDAARVRFATEEPCAR